jgi:hypothetical protein
LIRSQINVFVTVIVCGEPPIVTDAGEMLVVHTGTVPFPIGQAFGGTGNPPVFSVTEQVAPCGMLLIVCTGIWLGKCSVRFWSGCPLQWTTTG